MGGMGSVESCCSRAVIGLRQVGFAAPFQDRNGHGADGAGVVAQQKMDHSGHVGGGNPLGEIGLGHVAPVCFRVHRPRQNAVSMDIVAFQFAGQDFGELADRALGDRVGSNARAAAIQNRSAR